MLDLFLDKDKKELKKTIRSLKSKLSKSEAKAAALSSKVLVLKDEKDTFSMQYDSLLEDFKEKSTESVENYTNKSQLESADDRIEELLDDRKDLQFEIKGLKSKRESFKQSVDNKFKEYKDNFLAEYEGKCDTLDEREKAIHNKELEISKALIDCKTQIAILQAEAKALGGRNDDIKSFISAFFEAQKPMLPAPKGGE